MLIDRNDNPLSRSTTSSARLRDSADVAQENVPILTYHSLDASGSNISTDPQVFQEQVRLFREWGWQGITLSELLAGWEGKRVLPPRSVVFTFDDALSSVMEYAIPVLSEADFRATVFAVADYCGTSNDWPSQPASVPRQSTMSFSQLRELAQSGFEIGAHTLTHPQLPRLSRSASEHEIVRSKDVLEQQTGHGVNVFAYPYGLTTPEHREIAQRHFRGACGVTLRRACLRDNRFELPRVDMYYFRSLSTFRLFGTFRGRIYLDCRRIGRACRAALQSN